MYVRTIKSKNGKTYVQVIEKRHGKYKVLHSVGNTADAKGIDELIREGELWINKTTGVLKFDFSNEKQVIEHAMESIQSLELIGLELLLAVYLMR